MHIPLLRPDDYRFPDPSYALSECDGLVGVSTDLAPQRLLSAYRSGIFPWFSQDGYFFWYAVAPRAVIIPDRLTVGRSLSKTLRNKTYLVTANRCFDEVIGHCASVTRPRQDGTWIAPEFQTAYKKLHESGFAHSFECFLPDGNGAMHLAGGFYGVQIGSVFYGESMFALRPDASKIAFACAVPFLSQRGIALIDCQQDTEHMRRFGSQLLDFGDFQERLRSLNNRQPAHPIGKTDIRSHAKS